MNIIKRPKIESDKFLVFSTSSRASRGRIKRLNTFCGQHTRTDWRLENAQKQSQSQQQDRLDCLQEVQKTPCCVDCKKSKTWLSMGRKILWQNCINKKCSEAGTNRKQTSTYNWTCQLQRTFLLTNIYDTFQKPTKYTFVAGW